MIKYAMTNITWLNMLRKTSYLTKRNVVYMNFMPINRWQFHHKPSNWTLMIFCRMYFSWIPCRIWLDKTWHISIFDVNIFVNRAYRGSRHVDMVFNHVSTNTKPRDEDEVPHWMCHRKFGTTIAPLSHRLKLHELASSQQGSLRKAQDNGRLKV